MEAGVRHPRVMEIEHLQAREIADVPQFSIRDLRIVDLELLQVCETAEVAKAAGVCFLAGDYDTRRPVR